MTHQCGDIGAGIAALTILLDQHTEGIAAIEPRLALAQLIGRQF